MTESPRPGSLSSRLAAAGPAVLVVEDEEDIAEFLRAYFQASGLALEHLDPETPEAVAAAVAHQRPQCMLLDLRLRGFSGLEAYRLVRADPANALLPVIVLTADCRPGMRQEVLSRGVDAFVTKPFNVRTLFALVEDRIAEAAVRAAISPSPATGDTVTGAATHSYLQDRLADELGLATHTDRPVALVLVRLRSLRDTNHTLGHAAGDHVLREIARRLIEEFPTPALVGRSDGDELAIVVPGADAPTAMAGIASTLDRAGTPVRLPSGAQAQVLLAAGVAVHPDHAADPDGLYMAADAALAAACEYGDPVRLAL